jgi:pyruvate,water dikinase
VIEVIVKSGDRRTIGNKAFDLYRCTLLNIKVPQFCVIPTEVCKNFDRHSVSPQLESELKVIINELGGEVAVRSSSTTEDSSRSSNAGRFKTVLNVKTISELLGAVEAVRDSADGIDIGVIIQKQLKPEISGVLFTRNPVSGKKEIVIEYVKDLGDKLVSGKVNPKRIILNKGKKANSGNGFERLVRTSIKLERNFGYPLDIEWAKCHGRFFILQARPITNLSPPDMNRCKTYSRVQAEQFYSGPVSPLFYSFFDYLHSEYYLQETIETLGWDLQLKSALIRHKSHLYIDTALAEYVYSNLPVGNGRSMLEDVFPEDIKKELKSKKSRVDPFIILKLLKVIITNTDLWIWNLDSHFKNEIVPDIISNLEELGSFEGKDLDKLEEAYEKIMDTAVLHIRVSKWGLALYLPPLMSAMKRFLEKNKLDETLLSELLTGLPTNKTMDASMELQNLAKLIRTNKSAVDIINSDLEGYSSYKNKLLKDPANELIIEYFESIIKRYGHRRLSRDILTPSWKDEPEIPFYIIKKMICDWQTKFIDRGSRSILRRKQVEKQIMKKLNFMNRMKFRFLMKYFIQYVTFREYQRFYLDMIISKMRELVIEIGKRMNKDGILELPEDIFFIELDDLKKIFKGKLDHCLLNKSKFNRVTFENEYGTPGKFMRMGVDFDSIEIPKKNVFVKSGNIIKGESVSPGRFSGKVRIIPSFDSKTTIEHDEIVVTKCIDPGQTHVFLLAGALVMEVGGILSHGAILAREFNIPTVASVQNATGLFKNGQKITVNGTKGEIIFAS